MIVWLWDAGNARGVTDDESRAQQAAQASLRGSGADTARVEGAALVTGVRTLTTVYRRTGTGWLALRDRNGHIRWKAVHDIPASS